MDVNGIIWDFFEESQIIWSLMFNFRKQKKKLLLVL